MLMGNVEGGFAMRKVTSKYFWRKYVKKNRFSEDIDLSMNRKPTESERKVSKELIVSIADSLGMTLMNPDKIRSRHDYLFHSRQLQFR